MAQELAPGTLIGDRFRIERVAGVGGMGVVYRAQDSSTESIVALKVLLHESDSAADRFTREASVARGHVGLRVSNSAIDRFKREAELLAQLDHPAIVRHVAHGKTTDDAPWLAMEWLEGEDLAQRIAREGLHVSESIGLAERLADALGAAHACGIVHRDIKPSNVFLPGGIAHNAKILDFGIARPLLARTALTRTGSIVGTPGYMAPEQLEGNAAIDARADVFSLGAVLFECLTGKPAFAGQHVMAVLARLLLEEAPRVDEFRHDVPESLVDLVARMLSRDRDKRPLDGRAVRHELSRLGHWSGAPPAQHTSSPSLTASEQRLLCMVVALTDIVGETDIEFGATVPANVNRPIFTLLESAMKSMDARVDELGGAILVSLLGTQNPADQVARAARCALAMRAFLPNVPMMIVTGRGETYGRLPVGPIVDRAANFLERSLRPDSETETRAAIYLDDVTRALLDVRFDMTETAVGAELLGEREVGESSRSLLGKATPCVGRERELSVLQGLVDEAISESCARAALVTGVPGIGKSRVRYEMVRRLRERFPELSIWVGRADQVRAGSAYFLIGSALRHAAAITGTETAEVRREKLVELALVVRPEERARIAAFLGEIVGESFPDETVPSLRLARLDATVMATEVQRAFHDFMVAVVDRGPVCLVLEDLHWADAPSVRFFDRALGALRDRPFCVIALARPDVFDTFPRLFVDRNVSEIRLGELGRKAAEKLVKHALGDQVDAATMAKIVDRAAGNAFVLEEMIRAVAEHRSGTLPETVLGMVEARLVALSTDERRILRAASIFGETFWALGVSELAFVDRPSQDTLIILDKLVESEVLRKNSGSRFEREQEYSFRHALIREGAYAMLTDVDRVLGHKLAAEWLERAGETDPVVLAEHWEQAQELAKSAVYFARAAEQALRLGDLSLAIDRAERGFACRPESDVQVALHIVESEAYAFLGKPNESTTHAERILDLATPGTLSHTLALAGIVSNANAGAQSPKFAEALPMLLSVEPTADARGTFAWALCMVADAMRFVGAFDMADHFITKLQLLVDHADNDPIPQIWLDQAQALRAQIIDDNPFVALRLYSRVQDAFERLGRMNQAAYAQVQILLCLGLLGADDEIARLLDRTHINAASSGFIDGIRSYVRVLLLLRQGKIDAAIAAGQTALAALAGHRMNSATVHLLVAQVFLAQGNIDLAAEHLAMFRELRVPISGDQVALDALDAAITFGRNELPSALAHAERAIASRNASTPYGSYIPLAYVVRARTQMALGETDAARAGIAEAYAWLIARADKVDDSGLQKSFLEQIPENAEIIALASSWGISRRSGTTGEPSTTIRTHLG